MECMFQAIRMETAKAATTAAPGLQELAMASSHMEPASASERANNAEAAASGSSSGAPVDTNHSNVSVTNSSGFERVVANEKSTLPKASQQASSSARGVGGVKELRMQTSGGSETESEASEAEDDDSVVGSDEEGRMRTTVHVLADDEAITEDSPTKTTDQAQNGTGKELHAGDRDDTEDDEEEEEEEDDQEEDCSFRSRHEAYEITKSPYSTDERFEWDEDVFATMSQVLTPVACPWLRQSSVPCEDAINFFGKELANDVIKFCDAIESTGMAYSPLWTEGQTINGQSVPRIPGPIMLICLWEAKISGADSATVQRMVLDLDVYGLVSEAILAWKLANSFPGLQSMLSEASKSPALRRKLFSGAFKLDCQSCAIFVARAYQASQILQRAAPESRLRAKVRACLDMMAEHISTPDSMTFFTAPSPTATPQGKKRGRKPKTAATVKRRKSDASHSVTGTPLSTTNGYLTPTNGRTLATPAVAITDTKKNVGESCDSSIESVPATRVQLCSSETGAVLVTFESLKKAGAATETSRGRLKERITEGKVVQKEFYWRYEPAPIPVVSSTATPSPKSKKVQRKRVVRSMSDEYDDDDDEDYAPNLPPLVPSSHSSSYSSPRAVEKVCLATGQVLGVYETQAAACDAVGVSRSFFCQRMKAAPTTFSGYMWRWSEAAPKSSKSLLPTAAHKQPGRPGKTVEKCCLDTGAVLAKFGSLRKAAKSLGISNTNFGHMMKQAPVEHDGFLWRLSSSKMTE